MTQGAPTFKQKIARFVRKFCVSAFVVFSFAAYAIHEHSISPDVVADGSPVGVVTSPTLATNTNQAQPPIVVITQVPPASVSNVGQPVPTKATAPTAVSKPTITAAVANGQYRDGTYTGSLANARFGMVQVQATIQSGKITNVQFLQYPSDRRTSQRINQIATPRLVQEAIQAQSAKVNIISGATLTSRAFMESLQSALTSAKA